MKYKNWKQLLTMGLGFTLMFCQTAYANVTMIGEPLSIGNSSGSAGNTAASPAPDVLTSGFGKGSVLIAGSGMADTRTQPTPAVAAGQSQTTQSEITKPAVSSEGAVLMDAATGQVLFGKNENQQFYPASITKVMTALLVLEHCSLNDIVTFSASATTNLESGAVALGIVEGDQLTVEQCLYGLLLKSANEIGNGLAEHVAGSVSAFADMMNEKARSLGCKNTNFENPHGLNNPEHKTTPYDMALIMRAALQNETFRRIDSTTSYKFPATKNAEARTITMGHKMLYPSDSRYYEGIIGGKTGYTSKAGNTLVTGVEKNGVRLVAVIMKSQSTHYADTKAMLDYGFAYYQKLTGHAAGSAALPADTAFYQGTSTVEIDSQQSAGMGGTGTGSLQDGGPGTAGSKDAAASGIGGATNGLEGPAGTAAAESTAAAGITAAPTESDAAAENTASAARTGWVQDSVGWYYIKDDGTPAASEWLTLDGYDYWFDSSEYMATGWRQFTNGAWYYFRPHNGTMARSRWIEDGGAWYYLGDDGVLMTNTTTPDGYQVDENGIWIQ